MSINPPQGIGNGQPLVSGAGRVVQSDENENQVIENNSAKHNKSEKATEENQPSFFKDKFKSFFKQVISALGVVFGISTLDNKPYVHLLNQLNAQTQHSDDTLTLIQVKAKYLLEKSKEVISHGKRQIEAGKDPWEGLSLSDGIPMSAKQVFVSGNSLEQHYYHNCAAYNLANAILNETKIKSYNDIDNTRVNKNLDPEDTSRFQASEVVFWGNESSRIAPSIGVEENVVSARGAFPTLNGVIPEALEKNLAYALLNGAIEEMFGRSFEAQIEGIHHAGISVLNSSLIHTPGQPIKFSAKLLRERKLFEFLESNESAKVNGKSFREALLELVRESGCCYFEPKGVPKYILDTHTELGEVYLEDYLKIIDHKKKQVDDVLAKLPHLNDEERKLEEKKAWLHFANAVQNGNISLTDSYQELLKNNPQAFFNKVTEGILIAPVIHYVNRHGTPIEDFPDKLVQLFRDYANNSTVRREVAKLNVENYSGNKLHSDIKQFRRQAIFIFQSNPPELEAHGLSSTLPKDIQEEIKQGILPYIKGECDGIKAYLDWRILRYFEDNCDKKSLLNIKLPSGDSLFDCTSDTNLVFSRKFLEYGNEIFQSGGLDNYVHFVKSTFSNIGGVPSDIVAHNPSNQESVLDTFLPQNCTLDSLNDLRKKDYKDIKDKDFFYPSEMFTINNTRSYNPKKYSYDKIINLVKKNDELNPQGQYYVEIQPAREKYLGLPGFAYCAYENVVLHAAGDSKADIGMLAAALERGGYADIVFSLIQDEDIFKEIVKQRLSYVSEFRKRDTIYQDCKNQFGVFALEQVKDKKGFYYKVEKFENGKAVYEKDSETNEVKAYDEESLIRELRIKYSGKLIHNTSPEAYLRRRAEQFSLISGDNIELNKKDLQYAQNIFNRKQNGETLNDDEEQVLKRYERLIREKLEGYLLPQEAPRFNVRREWHGEDSKGKFIVYRSKNAGGALVLKRQDDSKAELFEHDIQTLSKLKYAQVLENDLGKFVSSNGKEYTDLETLDDHVIEDQFVSEPPKKEGLFANKTLNRIFGEKNLKSFICNLPNLFQGLLKYSGSIMALGGVVRLASKFSGGLEDSLYKTGYWMSNGLRAFSALGGVLRGELNVHKYHNIAFGEIINIISSFLPDGSKHLGLGFGNFVLFLGRGQQRAQLQQRVNNHTKEVLKETPKTREEVDAKEIDPRPFVRRITTIATDTLLSMKNVATKSAVSQFLGEVVGNIGGAIFSTYQITKDVVKNPGLLFQIKERMSEKSGSFYKSVPSAGHLLTLVGAFSGVSALVAGLFGKMEKYGEIKESGFNGIGNIALALANAIPALGIVANAKEVMANPGGLPKMFNGLNGKDATFNPQKAGLRQMIAGLGFGIVPFFGLHNKYVASFFDIFNGLYFTGAAEEELPNTTALGMSILRKGQQLYKDPEADYRLHEFSKV